MQARYVILRVLLENAPGLVSIEYTTGSDGNPDILVCLDKTKIESLGKSAIGDFLRKLQVRFLNLQALKFSVQYFFLRLLFFCIYVCITCKC